MEVNPGYKQTEVGVIPEEWEVPYLRQHLLQDATYGVVKAGAFQRSGIPMLRSGEIKNAAIIEDHPLITPEKSHEYSRTILKKNDVVIALVGYPGETAVIPERLVGANISRAVGLLRPASNLTPEFLACYLNSPNGRKEFLRPSAGSAQIVVNLGALNKLRLPVPPLPEQRAIATALSDVDGLLGGLDRLIAKKRDLKQAAMQQLLTGQTRLPGFHGEWEVKTLGDAGKCLRGVSYKGDSDLSTHDTIHTKRLLRSNNVQNAIVVTDEVQFVNAARVSAHQILKKDDILVCMANGSKALVGKAGIFMVSDGHEYTFGAFMGCFRTNSVEANPAFVFYLFLTGRYRDYINNLLAGSSINNLRPSSIELLEFPMPPVPEQTAIAAVLSDMDAELAALEQRWDKTRALKQAMMQELLTGRTQLVSSQKAIA